jgi:hypothetical protein
MGVTWVGGGIYGAYLALFRGFAERIVQVCAASPDSLFGSAQRAYGCVELIKSLSSYPSSLRSVEDGIDIASRYFATVRRATLIP